MHIDNTYLTNRTIVQTEDLAPATDTSRRPPTVAPDDSSSHIPSAELLGLVARVKQDAEIRPDVIARVTSRLSGGYYQSPEAVAKTVEAILQAP
jgi:hypothetical protein